MATPAARALPHHEWRHEWLDLDGFVRPISGAVEGFPGNAVNTALFAGVLARLAAAVGVGAGTAGQAVIPVLDHAGWHGGGTLGPRPRASGSCSCRPTRPSCNRPSGFGR